jgi:hypothetical protein
MDTFIIEKKATAPEKLQRSFGDCGILRLTQVTSEKAELGSHELDAIELDEERG